MAGIDWEGLTGAEGADIQEAYDDMVARAERQVEWYDDDFEESNGEEEEAAVEQRGLYSVGLWRPAHELETLRKKMQEVFHQSFFWEYDSTGRISDLHDATYGWVMLTKLDSRWCLAFPLPSKEHVYWGFADSDPVETLEEKHNQNPFSGEWAQYVEWEYDADGLPLKLVQTFGECKTVWDRTSYSYGEVTWVYDVHASLSGAVFSLREMWCRGELIWRKKARNEDPSDLSELKWYTPPVPQNDNNALPF